MTCLKLYLEFLLPNLYIINIEIKINSVLGGKKTCSKGIAQPLLEKTSQDT